MQKDDYDYWEEYADWYLDSENEPIPWWFDFAGWSAIIIVTLVWIWFLVKFTDWGIHYLVGLF